VYAFGQFHNGDGDRFGQVEAKPHGAENDEKRNDGEGNVIGGLNRFLQQLDLLVSLKAP